MDVGNPGPYLIEVSQLDDLLTALREDGFRVIGPVEHDGVIACDEIEGVRDLPAGRGDDQEAAHYRLRDRADGALFGYTVGPHSWKKFLHPPRLRLLRAVRANGDGFRFEDEPDPPKMAFLGVRACELAAIAVQDRVFLAGRHADPAYGARRGNAFLIAVQCGEAGHTCFCASMNTGPRAKEGFDLALTELVDVSRHRFLLEVGSPAGRRLVNRFSFPAADEPALRAARQATARATSMMGRALDPAGTADLLARSGESPHWKDVAKRCLGCTNCTLVCPTCFCSTVEDVTDLDGQGTERWRRWDSCFTMDFSYIHGGSVRASGESRYRQWITHKLSTWQDQFDVSGCVGCGRCIAWCPAGIDITAEAAALRALETKGAGHV